MHYDGKRAHTLMALNGPEVATRWVDKRTRTWWPPLKWWHFTTHPNVHTYTPAVPLLHSLVHDSKVKWKDRRYSNECGPNREMISLRLLANSYHKPLNGSRRRKKNLLQFALCWSIHSHLIKYHLNWKTAGQMLCACLCLQNFMQLWWKMTCCKDDSVL